MTVINTNTGSLYAQQALSTNARGLASVTQQLSTGKRINNSVDDVAGMAISTRLTSQIRGLNQAIRNANDGISLIQTAEGATEQVTNILQRMRELAIQSSNDTNNSSDRSFLDLEFQQLKLEINRISAATQWNGANVLDGTAGTQINGAYQFQIGANENQLVSITLPNLQPYAGRVLTESAGTASTNVFSFSTASTNNPTTLSAQKQLGRTYKISDPDGVAVSYSITQDDINGIDASLVPLGEAVAKGLKNAINSKFSNVKINNGLDSIVATNSGATLTLTTSGSGTQAKPTGLTIEILAGKLGAIETINILSQSSSGSGVQAIDIALQALNAERSNMGAIISRLQFSGDNLANISAKAQESRSRIEDTDYSLATTELAKRNIIQQAAQAMLAQANQAPQLVLQLLK